MKYLKQFGIILSVTCAGEIIKSWIPLPIPGSIYGLVLMLVLLMTRAVKLEQVKDAGRFLIEIMPLMFIPAAVGIMASWEQLQPILIPVCVITVISTVLVMVVTGKVTDLFVEKKEESGK